MKSKKSSMFLCRALVSLIVALMIGFLGLGVRAFATADTTKFILDAAFVVSVVILALYFMLRRSAQERTAHSLFREPPLVNRSLFPFAQAHQLLRGDAKLPHLFLDFPVLQNDQQAAHNRSLMHIESTTTLH
jgi:uncharacterized membrane protein YtjA (UPF0391 family)